MKRTLLIETLIVIVLAVIFTVVISALNLDMRLESAFYDPIQKWKISQIQPWIGFYHYGNLPGILLLIVSLAGFLLGFWIQRITKFRKLFALFILAVILGPGLLVNAVFKDHWGRPRPRDIVEFGGQMQFREVWQPIINGKGKSFPCCPASIGFVLFIPYFWLRRRRPVLATTILAGGLAYGGLMGVARMAQGGHFLSDVVWSAAMVYLVSAAIADLLRIDENPFADETAEMMGRQKTLATALAAALTPLLLGLFLVATVSRGNGQQANPWKNGRMEVSHGKCLSRELVGSPHEARVIPEAWRIDYNTSYSHRSFGEQTPKVFARRSNSWGI